MTGIFATDKIVKFFKGAMRHERYHYRLTIIGESLMTLKKTFLLAIAVCGILLATLVISASNEPPRIMVLHSYATDYVWTNLINQSLAATFRKSKSDVKIRYFYMDTRNLNYHKGADLIENSFIETVQKFDPQVIIAVDDAAQKVIAKNYLNHRDIGIVFAGVNYSIEKYRYADANNITGIFEHKPIATIKKVIEQLDHLQGKKASSSILFLADNSISSHNNADFLAKQDWGNIQYQGIQHTTDYAQWQKFITEESAHYDYILVSGYRQLLDESGSLVDSAQVASWTQANSRCGVIGMNVFNSEDGILLSVGVSPFEQGSEMLAMALRIIAGTSPDEIPYRYPKRYILALSEKALFDQEVQQDYKKALLRYSAGKF